MELTVMVVFPVTVPPLIVSEFKCWGVVKFTVPPLTTTDKVEAVGEPASDWNVADPAVLVKVVPAVHCCNPPRENVPELLTLPDALSVPAWVKLPLLVRVPVRLVVPAILFQV